MKTRVTLLVLFVLASASTQAMEDADLTLESEIDLNCGRCEP